jgi:tetratricopeptide (TPR) repeat protein
MSRRQHFRLGYLLLLFLSCSPLSWAQQQYGSVVGELHVNLGDFPGRVLVELQSRGAPIGSTYTDEQGTFGFSQLTSNVYHLVIRDPRFFPVDQEVSLDLSVSSTARAQINLTRHDTPSQPNTPTQKGSNPYIIDTKEYRRHFPKKAVKEFDKGVEADHKGKPEDAIRHYEKALSLAPGFYPAHNNLGSDYLAKSNFAGAQAQFEEAIKLNQSDDDAHLNLANLYLMTKDYGHALESVQEGLRRQPNSALGQFLLGSINERLGKFPDAERALRQALQIDPQMSRVHLELVNLYLAQKKAPEASTELKAFLKDSPDDPLAARAREMLEKLDANP